MLGLNLKSKLCLYNFDISEAPPRKMYLINFSIIFRRLDGNPLICDCNSSFWLWDTANTFRGSRTFDISATCNSPAHLKNKYILSLSISDFACEEPKINTTPNLVEVEHQEDINLECIANGTPLPIVEWFINK